MAAAIELSVIAPCFNEEGNVAELVRRTTAVFDELGIDAELVLIDDGSRDRTWELIEHAAGSEPRVRGVRHHENRGIEGGWNSGIEAARGELLCLIDSDLQNRPEDIPRLYRLYRSERPDMVQAVRHTRGVQSRKLFSRGLNTILNVSFGMSLRDNKSGFILASRAVLAELLQHRFRYRYFQSFIGAAAGVRGYRIAEVDTDFHPRQAGKSFLSDYPVVVSLRICGELLKYRAETLPIQLRRR
jgi:glycosyltransferase involved in cell wall biosynthesis